MGERGIRGNSGIGSSPGEGPAQQLRGPLIWGKMLCAVTFFQDKTLFLSRGQGQEHTSLGTAHPLWGQLWGQSPGQQGRRAAAQPAPCLRPGAPCGWQGQATRRWIPGRPSEALK